MPALALRPYGPESVWQQVGQRLLDDACARLTGRQEDEVDPDEPDPDDFPAGPKWP
ncbi:hypothetical protein [Bradyrhizobium uaiense]|uniref:hypothetical protein n=1 Tax=Bradyrhizobium uaiense TaxID=2594946 RepID=UPI0013D58413|nr:hypothetical protein [Bradyrhizobium uaiense]